MTTHVTSKSVVRSGDDLAFEDALAALKRRGSVSLVVGTVPAEAYRRVSRRMLGDRSAAVDRRRLLIVPDAERESALARLRATGRTDPSYARVVTTNGTARSTATGDERRQTVAVDHVDGSLGDVGVAVTDAVERFKTVSGGLSPAELRVGVDAFGALDDGDLEAAFAFLCVFGRQVRAADGMAHVRLARPYDARRVRTLAPLCDAVVELRLDGYRLEQRWHLRDEGVVSDWLPVDASGGGGRET